MKTSTPEHFLSLRRKFRIVLQLVNSYGTPLLVNCKTAFIAYEPALQMKQQVDEPRISGLQGTRNSQTNDNPDPKPSACGASIDKFNSVYMSTYMKSAHSLVLKHVNM